MNKPVEPVTRTHEVMSTRATTVMILVEEVVVQAMAILDVEQVEGLQSHLGGQTSRL